MGVDNLSFRTKMFLITIVVTLVPMLLISVLLYQRSQQSIVGQTEKIVVSSLDFAMGNIDAALDNVTGLSKLILTDTRIRSFAEKQLPDDELVRNAKYAEMLELLNFFIARIKVQNVLQGIDSFYLYLPNHSTLIDSASTFYENVDTRHIDFLNEKAAGKWLVTTPVNYYTLNGIETRLESEKLISFKRELQDSEGNLIAVLAVNVRNEYIGDYYGKVQKGVPGEFFVMDSTGNLLAWSDKNHYQHDDPFVQELSNGIVRRNASEGILERNAFKQFAVYSTSGYTGWKYIVAIPSSEILGKVYELRSYALALLGVVAVFMVGVTLFLSNLYYRPLLKLVKAMQAVENRNLDIRIVDRRMDEYRKVFQGFNNMTEQLKDLVLDLANEKVLKKDAEIKLLQAQINPHFLYNTLDSIYSIAKIKKVEEIAAMVEALSKFFRVSLSSGRDMVALKEAVALVEHYLTILNIRYRGAISFEVHLPEAWSECEVPKLILQPIVENSVYHGLETKKGSGRIVIGVTEYGGELSIVVEDNGIGIEEAEVIRINQAMVDDTLRRDQGFALRNLAQQIRLLYGANYGVDLESEYGVGTIVTVRLPVQWSDRLV